MSTGEERKRHGIYAVDCGVYHEGKYVVAQVHPCEARLHFLRKTPTHVASHKEHKPLCHFMRRLPS